MRPRGSEETLEEKIRRVTSEDVAIVSYDPRWPEFFQQEKARLRACPWAELFGRIEHFGSTSVPGLAAKPIVDMLIEVKDARAVRERIPPFLEPQGYDYFWRPALFDGPPYYSWFIKRGPDGVRTHHLHMVEPHFEHWERLKFRDYLIAFPDVAEAYEELKYRLASDFPNDRVAYTKGKTEFIVSATKRAKAYFSENKK